MKKLKTIAAVIILITAFILTGCSTYSYVPAQQPVSYENPHWAPPYYPGARYYYMPDVECYYDLSTREFIYLNRGQWYYSSVFPPYYPDFDLDNCFLVILNVNVYRPWMHHQYYVSHYPRYYYRNYYDHNNIPYVRGFNENSRSAFYWKENERSRARSWDDRNLRDNRKFRYSKEDRQQQRDVEERNVDRDRSNDRNINTRSQREAEEQNRARREEGNRTENRQGQGESTRNRDENTRTRDENVQPRKDNTQTRDENKATRSERTENTDRQPSNTPARTNRSNDTNYYGKTIGTPVKVDKQMKEDNRSSKSSAGRR